MEHKKLPSIKEQLEEIRNDYLQECKEIISAKTNDPKAIEEFIAHGAAAFDKSALQLTNGNLVFTTYEDGKFVGAIKITDEDPKLVYKN